MNKNEAFKIIAKTLVTGQIDKMHFSTDHIKHRKLTVGEIKKAMQEAVVKSKEKDVHPEEQPGGWGDAELANRIDWYKKLNLKEFFNLGNDDE